MCERCGKEQALSGSPGSPYCSKHTCLACTSPNNQKSSSTPFCERHMPAARKCKRCNKSATSDSNYCCDHKCTKCKSSERFSDKNHEKKPTMEYCQWHMTDDDISEYLYNDKPSPLTTDWPPQNLVGKSVWIKQSHRKYPGQVVEVLKKFTNGNYEVTTGRATFNINIKYLEPAPGKSQTNLERLRNSEGKRSHRTTSGRWSSRRRDFR